MPNRKLLKIPVAVQSEDGDSMFADDLEPLGTSVTSPDERSLRALRSTRNNILRNSGRSSPTVTPDGGGVIAAGTPPLENENDL